ncbi:class I SAM-dependent rRNA methyltransferase [Aliidiomarina indica]|uniref:class I SAM-dependent rRNA methyltransferase n=1 Tax=Aliidiomarina indica TaxID=2749147 RepID=UPI001890ADED|nr:class I SAM-dependent methyltransferase [Aliidiomarina indica]
MSNRIIIKPGREKSLLRRHPWIFSGAIAKIVGKPTLGETVDVYSDKGEWLAVAAYSPSSQIRARVWSFTRGRHINADFFIDRIQTAHRLREREVCPYTNAYRVVAGESDGLPGVTIDRYDDVLVVQLLSAGAATWEEAIYDALAELFPDCAVYERSDVDVRSKEGLAKATGPRRGRSDIAPIVIDEYGVKLAVDVRSGHKTGYYLDQRDARKKVQQYAKGKTVLNCFSYTGGFGLYAALAGAHRVINVDVSEDALEMARFNESLNPIREGVIEYLKADVFEQLRRFVDEGETFDVIVLDPPKFVDSKQSLNRACRGYKDINRLAASLLNPGGILMTFSCSGLLSSELFQKVVADGCLDAKVDLKIIDRTQQAPDHPVGIHYPEGWYLKGLVLKR